MPRMQLVKILGSLEGWQSVGLESCLISLVGISLSLEGKVSVLS